MDSSRMSSEVSRNDSRRIGAVVYPACVLEALNLLAKMDIRAQRANRGAGFKSQGCDRLDAVSARPMGHLVASLA
jgi:hypothetical protein